MIKRNNSAWQDRCSDEASDQEKLDSLISRSKNRPENVIAEFRFLDGIARFAYSGAEVSEIEAVQIVKSICPSSRPQATWEKESEYRISEFRERAMDWQRDHSVPKEPKIKLNDSPVS